MLDWDDLKTFLAIARHGTLSAAARALKVSQTTMGRRLGHLHEVAGTTLLERTPGGFRLTTTGAAISGASPGQAPWPAARYRSDLICRSNESFDERPTCLLHIFPSREMRTVTGMPKSGP